LHDFGIQWRYLNFVVSIWRKFDLSCGTSKKKQIFFGLVSLIISTRIGSYYFWFICMALRFFRCSICASFRESISNKSIFKLDGDNDETTSSVIFLRRGIDTELIFISEFSSSQKSTLDVEDFSEDQINNSCGKWRIHFV